MKRLSKLFSMLLAVMLVLQCGYVCVFAGWEADPTKTGDVTNVYQMMLDEAEQEIGPTVGDRQLIYPKDWNIVYNGKTDTQPTDKLYANVETSNDGGLTAPYLLLRGNNVSSGSVAASKTFSANRDETGVLRVKFKYSMNHGGNSIEIKLCDSNNKGITIGSKNSKFSSDAITVDGENFTPLGNSNGANRFYVTNPLGTGSSPLYALASVFGGYDEKKYKDCEVIINNSESRISTVIGNQSISLGNGIYAVMVSDWEDKTHIVKGRLPEGTGEINTFSVKSFMWSAGRSMDFRLKDLSVDYEKAEYKTEPEFENWKGVVWGGYKTNEPAENIPALVSNDADDLSDLGVGWTRIGVSKNYNQDRVDNAVLRVNEKGVNVLICYFDADSPETMDNAYLKDLVSRYKNIVKYWEIGNEVNLKFGTDTQKLTSYAKRLKDAYDIIKTEDPEATVILGGISEYEAEKFVTTFKDIKVDGEHAYDFFDEVAFHPYGNNPDDAFRKLTSFKNAMKNNWDKAGTKPIWITEIGFHAESGWDTSKTPGYANTEATKAEYLTSVLNGLHEGLDVQRPVMWYTFHENTGSNGYGLTTTPTVQNGTVIKSRLDAYEAMKKINTKLALNLPINDDFTGYAGTGTLPNGWETASGAVSVIDRSKETTMKSECLKVPQGKVATRKFSLPDDGGLIEFSLKCVTDQKGGGKVISFKNKDKTGLKISYENNKIYLTDPKESTSEKVELGAEDWWVNTFDVKVNCSEEAIGALQPGEYELIFNKGGKSEKTVQGTLQNSLKALDRIAFYGGNNPNNAIYVDDVTVKVAEQNDVLKIDSVATTSEDITVGFDSSKTAVKGDIIVAADKTENDVNILSRIVGIKHGQLIPVGESSVTLPLGTAAKGETYRVFVFDSIQNLRPIMDSANTNK